jgi:hypothetical protein
MPKKLLTALILAGSLGVGGPAAHASVVPSACAFITTTQPDVTGTVSGVVYGYAAFDDTGTHTLRCYVTVNGGPTGASSPTRFGGTFLATAGQVTYTAGADDVVDVCSVLDGLPVSCTTPNETIPPPDFVCAVASGCEDSRALICIAALSGCNNDYDALVCVAGTGCNDGDATVCVADDGCNNENAPVCIAVTGCNNSLLSALDSTICPIIAALAPGVPGIVDIGPDGDVTVVGVATYDCPPYGNV